MTPSMIEKLLGRPEQPAKASGVDDALQGRRVLVTGAGGSIGAALCRRLLQSSVAEIIAVDRAECGLHALTFESANPSTALVPILGHFADENLLDRSASRGAIDIVFHAAAHKHVPLLESNAGAALENNVAATMELLRWCRRQDLESFVFVSTDKAVDPQSVMGTSKRIGERMIQGTADAEEGQTRWKTVRLANVLGSSASVLPRFADCLQKGNPLPLHGEGSERFFISESEAVAALVAALVVGKNGDILAADPGPPLKIRDLGTRLAAAMGQDPEAVAFKTLPPRPGDRAREKLWHTGESEKVPDREHLLLRRARHGASLSLEMVKSRVTECLRSGEAADLILRDLLSCRATEKE